MTISTSSGVLASILEEEREGRIVECYPSCPQTQSGGNAMWLES
jgi:hypothetical protein